MISTEAQHVDIDGIPVGYYVQGQGPEVVLLHGASGHPETSFPNLLDEMTKSRRVIVPGYSGSSLTPLPEGELDVDRLADQVLGVVRAAAHGPVDLIGFSTGAVVGAAAAAQEPGLVRRLILCGGFAHYGHPWQRLFTRTWKRLAELDANTFAEFTLLHAISDGHLDTLSSRDRLMLRSGLMPSRGMVALVDLISRLDISESLPKITSPTLVIGNRQDQLVPIRYARQFHEAISGAEYAELDSGHLAALERPEELVQLIEEFLDS
ncbi:pimeloyl-ACP methyl ester carboxylesterase [Kitasatospora sp. MAA4]|uniref:alpha/beta fold hydrolase n=1 Tax=Kitasatospora sp. MAA4 TaxID=3035093 RepID=UPI00247470AA|nr:alpha/beta hydrolase [Kitasatospora sp. MAA4]MDH6134227.1 pimeloyl-ACP methyl ester carboxylesterase [Kitasatospora sp. MAA4]